MSGLGPRGTMPGSVKEVTASQKTVEKKEMKPAAVGQRRDQARKRVRDQRREEAERKRAKAAEDSTARAYLRSFGAGRAGGVEAARGCGSSAEIIAGNFEVDARAQRPRVSAAC